MTFIPSPMSLRMNDSLHHVGTETICWDDPLDISLVGDVEPDDGNATALPLPRQPFNVSDPRTDLENGYATLSLRSRNYTAWKVAFQNQRRVRLTLSISGTLTPLSVQLVFVP